MPTYAFKCTLCAGELEHFMSVREYSDNPPSFFHCGNRMERKLTPTHLAVVSERSYQDLRASDGTDISTRAKHRAYMKAKNLTTIDDFKDTWAKQANERNARAAGDDVSRRHDIADAIGKLGG